MASKAQKEKWRKILLVTPLFFLFAFGNTLAGIVGKVLFVENVGSEYLPHTYVAGAILSSLLTMALSGLIKKWSMTKLLQFFSWAGAGLFLGNYLLLEDYSLVGYTVFLIVSSFFYLILGGTAIWRIPASLCTLFESKATFLYYSLAYCFGGILAGFISNRFEALIGLENLILGIVLSLILAALNLIFIQAAYSEELEPTVEEKAAASTWNSLKEELQSFKRNKLAKMLFVALTIFNVIWWISDFEFQKIVGDTLSEEKYSEFLALLSMVNNVLLIGVLFAEDRVIKKAGVLNALLLSPSLVFLAFGLCFLFPTPIFAFVIATLTPLVGYSLFTDASQSTYTALPYSIRNRVATFISGNSDALAMLGAGAGLMILTRFVSNEWILGFACVLLLIDVGIVFRTKKIYLQQVLLNLGSTNKIDMHGAIENLAEETYREVGVQELMKLISWRKLDNETVRKMIFSLGKMGNVKVIPSLLDLFAKNDATIKYSVIETVHSFEHLKEKLKDLPFTQLNLIEAYEKTFLEEEDADLKILILEQLGDFDPDKVITFLRNAMSDKNPEVSTKAIGAMGYFHDRGIVTYVRPYLESTDLMTQAAAVSSLWQFPELKPLLMKSFIQIMAGTTRDNILASLNLIGTLNFVWEKSYAQKHLTHMEKTIQNQAALTLLQLDDTTAIPKAVEALSEEKVESLFFARSLKKIPPRIKRMILKEVELKGERAITTCIRILKSSYLDFTVDIEAFGYEKTNLALNR